MCLSRAAVGEDGLLAAIVGITKEMAPISVITYPTASTASGLLQAVKQEGDREKQVERGERTLVSLAGTRIG